MIVFPVRGTEWPAAFPSTTCWDFLPRHRRAFGGSGFWDVTWQLEGDNDGLAGEDEKWLEQGDSEGGFSF